MTTGLQVGGSQEDIRPFISLASGLVKNGHQVTLAITDDIDKDFSEIGNVNGFSLIKVGKQEITNEEEIAEIWESIINIGNPIQQAEKILTYGFDPFMQDIYSTAKYLSENNDLVIGHFFVYPLQVAAEKFNTTYITINIVHNCLPSKFNCPPGMPDIGKWFYPIGWQIVRKMINKIFLPRVNKLRIREGLLPNKDVMTDVWASKFLNFIAVSPTICQPKEDWDKSTNICGFINSIENNQREELPEGLDEFLNNGEPPVYLTFGSMMKPNLKLIQKTVSIWSEAIELVSCRAIFQIPWNDLSIFDTEKNVFKVKRSPYLEVFPRCSLIVHHGGAGTTQSSLISGKPSIIVAFMSDQTFWGSELERLGVAGKTILKKSLTSKQLAKRIRSVLAKPSLSEKAKLIGEKLKKENGLENALLLIEELIQEK